MSLQVVQQVNKEICIYHRQGLYPLFTHHRTLRCNRPNKMAPLLHFVKGLSHIDAKCNEPRWAV